MLRFRSLGSGSSGNATLVEAGDGLRVHRLLVDCGFGMRQLATRLAAAGLGIDQIDAIFITHEHADHVGCAQTAALRHRIPIWMSPGTHAALGAPDLGGLLHTAQDMEPIDLGPLCVLPFTVPHDAREPLQLRCTDGALHLGLLTDLGHASSHVLKQLQGCHALLLEANHDPDLLAASSYPTFLKRRIGGEHGHLANHAAAGILKAVQHPGLHRVVAAHLSAQNTQPWLAQEALAHALKWPIHAVDIASAATGTDWIDVAFSQ